MTGRVIRERRTHHIPDLGAVPNLSPTLRERVDRHGGASLLYAPMLWEERGLGSILVVRWPPRPFSDREQALLQTFADQAAIAVQNARLFNETQEALEHQKASGEVLRAIAQSVADAAPVFENILDASQRLFGTEEVCIFMVGEDGMVRPAAARGPGFSAARNDVMPLEGSRTGRVIRERRVHHIPDGLAEPDTPPALLERMRRSGNVSIAFAPMLWEDSGLGSIAILRSPPRPFSERELELLRGFADQAVIAIQNARMFREVQAKTRDLEESLTQQTATAEVLKVISRSAFGLSTVLKTLVDSAVRLCAADGVIYLKEGDVFLAAAAYGSDLVGLEARNRTPRRPGRDSVTGRVALTGEVVQIPDNLADPEFTVAPSLRLKGIRAMLGVPLMRDGEVEGVFVLGKPEPGLFGERAVELARTFADQAVIAVQNVRLFEAVQAKSRDLEEALQQQTATSEVLKVISRSAFDLDAVLNSLTRSAVELCNSTYGAISLYRDGVLKFMAQTGCTPEFAELLWSHPARLDRKSATGRAGLLRSVVLIPDVTEDDEYDYHGGEIIGNYRSMMAVPLLRNGELEGVFTLMRGEPGTFTPASGRTRRDLCRPGGDRHRERAPVRRGAGAHARCRGGAASSRLRPPTC